MLQDPVLLPLDLDLRVCCVPHQYMCVCSCTDMCMCVCMCAQLPWVMTDLKGVASGLGIDQKLLQQLSAAASSLEADPACAVTLAGNCVFVCPMRMYMYIGTYIVYVHVYMCACVLCTCI